MLEFIFDFLHGAIIVAIKNYKWVKWVYIGLVVALILSYGSFYVEGYVILTSIVTVLAIGIWQYILSIPFRIRLKEWQNLFERMKLDENDNPPFFLYEKDISPIAYITAFKTTIPLSVWNSKKEAMEMIINKKISYILQDEENNQIIKIIVQKKPLPTMINWEEKYRARNFLNIGISHMGMVGMDLEKHPHAFIAGETGSGKSNILKCMIHQALNKGYDVILIDFKRGVSFSEFGEAVNIYYDYVPTADILGKMIIETVKRLDLFRENRVDNLNDYNRLTDDKLKRKIVFIDELAELLKTSDKALSKRLYDSIETLTRLSRAVGINLIMGIQRPDSTILSGQIKNNVSFRVCGRFVDKEPSRIMLGCDNASRLANIKGRFIVKDSDMHEIQSFYYSNTNSYQSKPKRRARGLETDNIARPRLVNEEAPIKQEPPTLPRRKKTIDGVDFDFSDVKK